MATNGASQAGQRLTSSPVPPWPSHLPVVLLWVGETSAAPRRKTSGSAITSDESRVRLTAAADRRPRTAPHWTVRRRARSSPTCNARSPRGRPTAVRAGSGPPASRPASPEPDLVAAPAPAILNEAAGPRPAPIFVEWLMGLPESWVTSSAVGLTHAQQLTALGNGVVPDQAARALRVLLRIRSNLIGDQEG
jgi:hypothetical protein